MKAKADFNPFLETTVPIGLSRAGTPFRVLLIDDSMFIRKQLAQILTSEKFEIVGEAADGLEGLDMYKASFPNVDLITIDITMPRMDGITCLEKIREFDPNARAIMVTAIGSQDIVKRALSLGAKNYIVKPLDRAKVLERIKSILPS
jgi:two-component system chemotaxis response regulator CheY